MLPFIPNTSIVRIPFVRRQIYIVDPLYNFFNMSISPFHYYTSMLQTDLTRHICNIFSLVSKGAISHSCHFHSYLVVCVAVCDVWLCLCSYPNSVATTATPIGSNYGMDYLDNLDDDINGIVNFNDLISGYRQWGRSERL